MGKGLPEDTGGSRKLWSIILHNYAVISEMFHIGVARKDNLEANT